MWKSVQKLAMAAVIKLAPRAFLPKPPAPVTAHLHLHVLCLLHSVTFGPQN
jgi:hypothetical protein